MIPALLLMRVGRERRVWLPLPFFLVWPFWLLGWLAWIFTWAFDREASGKIAVLQGVFWHLSGLIVEVESGDQTPIHFRFI